MAVYDLTIGTLLMGIFFNTYLYGLVTYQFAAYHKTKFGDRPTIKYMVLGLFLLDTVHSTSVIYMGWVYCVTNYNNPTAITTALWPYTLTPIATVSAGLATQIFLGHRIYRLSHNAILFVIVIVLALPSFACGMAAGIRAWIIKESDKFSVLNGLVAAWLTIQVTVDVFITATLTIILVRSRTGFRQTDSVVNRLIRGAIQTGLFVGIFSLGDLISFLLFPTINLYGMFAIPIGRIYTNTLLDTLLARDGLRQELATSRHMPTELCFGNISSSLQSAELRGSKSIPLKEVVVIHEDGQTFKNAASC